VTVVGAHPQFIKAAAVTPRLRARADELLVHTGQHYDPSLSDVFFEELSLPPPDVHLAVGSGSHGVQTGEMLARLDALLQRERPDWVLVYGDTNSTLAGALAAAKLAIPVAHVEAGLRSFNRAMPEEVNRVVTDHVATRLYCPTAYAAEQLKREGITEGVIVTGDVMDETVHLVQDDPTVLARIGVEDHGYVLATVHRQENTDDAERLRAILEGLGSLPWPVVLPLHPRTRERVARFGLHDALGRLRVLDPQGYRASLTLIRHARVVATDSGGVQREACALGVPCYVLREETEWVDLVENGQAVLVGADAARIRQAVILGPPKARPKTAVPDASRRIVEDLLG
jgi:UDP-N-acetylglucosamine 2-epimerase